MDSCIHSQSINISIDTNISEVTLVHSPQQNRPSFFSLKPHPPTLPQLHLPPFTIFRSPYVLLAQHHNLLLERCVRSTLFAAASQLVTWQFFPSQQVLHWRRPIESRSSNCVTVASSRGAAVEMVASMAIARMGSFIFLRLKAFERNDTNVGRTNSSRFLAPAMLKSYEIWAWTKGVAHLFLFWMLLANEKG